MLCLTQVSVTLKGVSKFLKITWKSILMIHLSNLQLINNLKCCQKLKWSFISILEEFRGSWDDRSTKVKRGLQVQRAFSFISGRAVSVTGVDTGPLGLLEFRLRKATPHPVQESKVMSSSSPQRTLPTSCIYSVICHAVF